MSLRILIGDDDPNWRSLIRRLLGSAASVVGEAETADEVVQLTAEHWPDIVLLDADLTDAGQVSLPRRIRATRPCTTVMLMTSRGEEAYLTSTGKSGADALLSKRSLRGELVPAMRQVAGEAGRSWDGRERRQPTGSWAARRYIGPERRASHSQHT
jgi:DNA-binding NarL/FixJ family response regulator